MLNITGARRARQQSVDLNITPLIDMVFILLIFFMVTTSFVKETGVEINRPSAATATSKEKASIMIGITGDGRVFMNKNEVDIRAVRAYVERDLAENPDAQVVIVADRESLTGIAISIMDSCRLAGAKNISLAASLPKE